jgi:hypothetical protein
MDMIKKLFPMVLLAIFLAGCATTNITNLTPTQYPRNPSGQYLVEMQIDSDQQTLRPDSIKPWVVVGDQKYPMAQTRKTMNRWEAMIPVGADKSGIAFHYKVDYLYNKFGKPGKGSLRSPDFPLVIK